MSFEDKKLQEAQQEAASEVGRLTEDELEQVSGGATGDARPNMNEAMADAESLEQDIDGFEF